MPKSAQRSPDPARDWAALYQLCQTYEQKLKDVAQSQVSRVCAGEHFWSHGILAVRLGCTCRSLKSPGSRADTQVHYAPDSSCLRTLLHLVYETITL